MCRVEAGVLLEDGRTALRLAFEMAVASGSQSRLRPPRRAGSAARAACPARVRRVRRRLRRRLDQIRLNSAVDCWAQLLGSYVRSQLVAGAALRSGHDRLIRRLTRWVSRTASLLVS